MTAYIGNSHIQGLAAVAQGRYETGDLIETNPIHILDPEAVAHVLHTGLKRHIFDLRESGKDRNPDSCYALIAGGNISFCNHSETPDCGFEIDEDAVRIRLYAERPIFDGAELAIDYGEFAREINGGD